MKSLAEVLERDNIIGAFNIEKDFDPAIGDYA
jgi:hypothetical protein